MSPSMMEGSAAAVSPRSAFPPDNPPSCRRTIAPGCAWDNTLAAIRAGSLSCQSSESISQPTETYPSRRNSSSIAALALPKGGRKRRGESPRIPRRTESADSRSRRSSTGLMVARASEWEYECDPIAMPASRRYMTSSGWAAAASPSTKKVAGTPSSRRRSAICPV